jgi:hypothetical protein
MRRLVICSTVVASALAGGGVGYAVAGGSAAAATPASVSAATGPSGGMHAAGPGHRRWGLRRLAGRIVVGEVTLRGPHGRYRTFEIQRGTVLSDSGGTMTVRSPNGSTVRYLLTSRTHYRLRGEPAATAGPPARGEQVLVLARVTSGGNDARRVVEGLPARRASAGSSGPAGSSGTAA